MNKVPVFAKDVKVWDFLSGFGTVTRSVAVDRQGPAKAFELKREWWLETSQGSLFVMRDTQFTKLD